MIRTHVRVSLSVNVTIEVKLKQLSNNADVTKLYKQKRGNCNKM